ncbi:uncharacterized protein LOC132875565 [Neoarius graeffei]|uniref:uncharacterized protein LOC132875565 n=1 Tax=Neoarius graeffei TaxID=443677 RepID=UPI00298D13A6|nr:uncharacterized protein LOC132875565 [Neoarius graeffei]
MFCWMTHWIVWLSICRISYMSGGVMCPSSYTDQGNISVKLQSDVLLPCSFNPTLLGSDKTADIAVVWSQRNTTSHNLLEILLKGELRPWNNKGGRIKAFPELSESGNFSILLEKVQLYDRGLYSCELFNGTSCRIAYQEIQLIQTAENILLKNWPFIVGGGAVALILLVVLICCIKRAHSNASNTRIYANSGFEKRNDKECNEKKDSSNWQGAKAKNNSYNYTNRCMEAEEIYANQPH